MECSVVFEVRLTQDAGLILSVFYVSMKSTIQSSGSMSVAGREAKPTTMVHYKYEQLEMKLPHAFPVYLQ